MSTGATIRKMYGQEEGGRRRKKVRRATAFGSDTNLSHTYIFLNKNKVRKTHCEERKKGGGGEAEGVDSFPFNSESLLVPFLTKIVLLPHRSDKGTVSET